jgi:Uma2 family endonuclease
MSAKVLMDVEEYLATSFEDADREYLDGEVVERNMGELSHSNVQTKLIILLNRLRAMLGIRVQVEIRIQIHSRRYRVADIAVWRNDNIGTRIPTVPPFLVVEVLSPEDHLVRMLPKIQEYLDIGVEYVWLVDPEERAAMIFSQQDPRGSATEVLRTARPDIEISLEAAFNLDA